MVAEFFVVDYRQARAESCCFVNTTLGEMASLDVVG